MKSASSRTKPNVMAGRHVGCEFLPANDGQVLARARLTDADIEAGGAVSSGLLTALAEAAARYGAEMSNPNDVQASVVESISVYLTPGSGSMLRIEGEALRQGNAVSVWRVRILRGSSGVVAEATQTLAYRQADDIAHGQFSTSDEYDDSDFGAQSLKVLEGKADKGLRKETVQDRQQKIFDAACRVISTKGFKDATIREIAAAAGMPVPTMYQYIKNKGDLLLVVYQHFMEDIERALMEVVSRENDPASTLMATIHCLLEKSREHEPYVRLIVQETRSLEEHERNRVFEIDGRILAQIKKRVAACRQDGTVTFPGDDVAANLIYFQCGLWPLRHWAMPNLDAETTGALIMEFLTKGLGMVGPDAD